MSSELRFFKSVAVFLNEIASISSSEPTETLNPTEYQARTTHLARPSRIHQSNLVNLFRTRIDMST